MAENTTGTSPADSSSPSASTPSASTPFGAALRQAALAATLAPSVHNTQPWALRLTGEALELRVDPERRLDVQDPDRRQLMLSVGCALMNARVGLHAAGLACTVDRFPDPDDPLLAARITVADGAPDEALARLEPAVAQRRSNRRRFDPEPLPEPAVLELEQAAAQESAMVFVLRSEDERIAAASLSQRADEQQRADPTYRAELQTWIGGDPQRPDGIPYNAIPRVDGPARDDVPIRQFDAEGQGGLPSVTESSMRQCLIVLGTRADVPSDWLRVGEALERMWLEATRLGYAVSPLTQIVEVAPIRTQLRSALRTQAWPCVMVRVGIAPPTPPTRRRPLSDVLQPSPGDPDPTEGAA